MTPEPVRAHVPTAEELMDPWGDGAAVPRGLPRPVNGAGLPVPYISANPRSLGKLNQVRQGEVILNDLCQVCGEPLGDSPCFAVFRLDPPGFEDRPFNGILHERCLRLSFEHCPELQRWEHKRLCRCKMTDLVEDSEGGRVLPIERHAACEVSADAYR